MVVDAMHDPDSFRMPKVGAAHGQLFALSLALFVTGLGLTALWRLTGGAGWWLPLLLGSASAALLAWRRICWPDAWTRYLSFGAVVLLACVANRVLYLAEMIGSDDSYLRWPFYASNPELSIIKAEVATLVGTLLTVFAWLAAGGARHSPGDVLRAPRGPLLRLLVVTYIASLLALLASVVAPEVLQVSGQLLPTMLVLGATTAFFVPLLVARRALTRLTMVLLMGLPFTYMALGTGMKENIILALAPTAYLLWSYARSRGARLALLAIAVMALAMVTSYISFFRGEVWHADRTINQSQVFEEFADSVGTRGVATTANEGWREFLSRNNAAPYRGWTMAIADADGYEPGLVFAPMLYVFVPRILWPEKPAVRQGWEYSGLVFGANYIAESDSSLSAGFYSGLYLGQGWLAVVVGAIAVGLVMVFLTRLAYRLGGPVLSGLFTLSLLPYALRLDEAWTVGAFSAPLINFVYIAAIFFLARLAAGLVKAPG